MLKTIFRVWPAGLLVLCAACATGTTEPNSSGAVVDSQLFGSVDTPPAVDPDLYAQLVTELERVVRVAKSGKSASEAPVGKYSTVPDFWLFPAGAGADARWSYRNQGDLDLNGETNIADLTQIGVHFGKTAEGPNWKLSQIADADGNGEVNIADVTPLGQNFGAVVAGFAVMSHLQASDPWDAEGWVPYTGSTPVSGDYPEFEFHIDTPDANKTYRVVPTANSAEPFDTGQSSNVLTYSLATKHFWSMQGGGPANTGQVERLGPRVLQEAWNVELRGANYPLWSPVADVYGTSYITTFINVTDPSNLAEASGYLHGVTREGEVKFSIAMPGPVLAAPVIQLDGTIIVFELTGTVRAYAPDGKLKWSQPLVGSVQQVVAGNGLIVDSQGNIFVTDSAPRLYKLAPDGSILWSQLLTATASAQPLLIGPTVAVPLDDDSLPYYLQLDGAPSGGVQYNGLNDCPVYNAGHHLLVPESGTNTLTGVAMPDPAFSYMVSSDISFSPAVLHNGQYIVGNTDSQAGVSEIIGLTPLGAFAWTRPMPVLIISSMAVDAEDYIYVSGFAAADASGAYCIDPSHNIAWTYPSLTGFTSPICIAYTNLATFTALTSNLFESTTTHLIAVGDAP